MISIFINLNITFQYWYYYRQRSTPEQWKCQPNHWLPADLERHEIIVGLFSLTVSSFISSAIACYVMNGGYSTFYYK